MRFFTYLLLLALLGYGIWPYFTLFRLDGAINQEGTAELSDLVDLTAIRANYHTRINAGLDGLLPHADRNTTAGWIRDGLARMGDAALDQAISVNWVRDTLRSAVSRATGQTPPYLLSATSFAFFETHNRFLIRIGELDRSPTHVRLTLQGTSWRITDIID